MTEGRTGVCRVQGRKQFPGGFLEVVTFDLDAEGGGEWAEFCEMLL